MDDGAHGVLCCASSAMVVRLSHPGLALGVGSGPFNGCHHSTGSSFSAGPGRLGTCLGHGSVPLMAVKLEFESMARASGT